MTSEEFNQQIYYIMQVESTKEAFFKLCDLYLIASAQQRKEIRQNYFFERDWEAPAAKTLAAHITGEPDREARIRASLILLSFVEEMDFRDGLVNAALIWNSLKDIGKDADGWFRYFADMSSTGAASIMNNFLNRSREDKDLTKWGWEREITEHGIVYKGWEADVGTLLLLGETPFFAA
jgi:hypothetical protein